MAKIVINNTAARNNGDVALITSLAKSLLSKGHHVMFATSHKDVLRSNQNISNCFAEGIFNKSRLTRTLLPMNMESYLNGIFSKAFRNADVIIGSPGGYINSYYGFKRRCAIYKWAHKSGKNTAIYAQSIGPLKQSDRINLCSISKYLDVLMTRDEHSKLLALDCGVNTNCILPSNDAIFLNSPRTSPTSLQSNIIGISVREWLYDNRSVDAYERLIYELSLKVVKLGFSIEFISTCQGIPGYIDDSELAKRIATRIKKHLGINNKIIVNDMPMNVESLKRRISKFHAIIGTRLHMCLLAMLEGVPAFNISYEFKGIECYRYMGIEEYSIDYNASANDAVLRLQRFFMDLHHLRARIPRIVGIQHLKATQDFETFLSRLGI